VPLFQPIVELSSGRMLAAEALVRWRHPTRGWLSPGQFIDAVERLGPVDALTWSVLDQSARACGEWRARGLDAGVSVNLSAVSLADARTAERIGDIVAAAGIDPRCVILEITESVAVTDVGHALENVARLRLRGFEIAVGDFGTGYSSMQQIARIPFTKLKIDRLFVHGAPSAPRLQVLVDHAIRMASQLGMGCVAERVETRAEWTPLARLGCEAAQVYCVAKPMPAGALFEWSKTWSPPIEFERRVASR
jgi:EAL domain-containing protein (putative c-di-GMP-specific phosphodiesterase class I)